MTLNMTPSGQTGRRCTIRRQCRALTVLCLLAGFLAPATGTSETTDTTASYIEQAEIAFDRADIVSAMRWYRKAAELGDVKAQTRLAYLLDKSEANEESVEWYNRATEQGHAEAQFGLAKMVAAGEGVAKDTQLALDLYTQAARQGYLPAIRVMSQVYEKGQLGLAVSYTEAIAWLNAGVEANDRWSIQRLSRAYRRGELGLKIDREQADRLEARLAAETPAAAAGE
jgi:TPR repeat protein